MTVKSEGQSDLASYYFHQGTNFMAYEYLGCHLKIENGKYIYTFRTWAPKADSIEVVGDFNGWNAEGPMTRITDMGVWEYVFESDSSLDSDNYKFRVISKNGVHLKADPYAFYSETLSGTASKIHDPKPFKWGDSAWSTHRRKIMNGGERRDGSREFYSAPLNIYEVHLASWRTRDGKSTENGENYLNYREIADELSEYVKQMGYTHVELMPVMEHPFDGSWGYQVCGYYAPTSRFGTPEDFKYFVDKMHRSGVGVILDWVPAHFPKDEHGLYEFDGYPLYEYQGKDRMEQPVWGTRFFDVGRSEVECFLISNALYWFREFHVDGLRVDAVASMLYLDYDRKPGEWNPNINGGNENLEAIAFFRKLNTAIFSEFPDVLMIAEESTAWPMVSRPVSMGGLGFNFKWNMGWANDSFDYVQTDPLFRRYKHNQLTFPMMYAMSENFILPVSHDEVVHGKRSLIDKMFGEYENKFSTARLFFTFQMFHAGKKLMFMGCEFGQFREWDYNNQLEWFMLDFDMHRKLRDFVSVLNRYYLEHSELWELDFSWDGFEWIYTEMRDDNIIAFRRRNLKGDELIAVLNFAPVRHEKFTVKKLSHAAYTEDLNTDAVRFGGSGITNEGILETAECECGRSLEIDLPGLSAVILKPVKSVKKPSATGKLRADTACSEKS